MIPLDRYEKWAPIQDVSAQRYLNAREYQAYRAIPTGEKLSQLQAILEKPISTFTILNEVYFRARWAEVLHTVYTGNDPLLLEIASGDADMIPQMLAHTYPNSRYITANMNKRLSRRLLEKTSGLPLNIRLIEADAIEIEKHLQPESVDIIAFQHAVNDVLQAILCDREGIDTIDADWMETLPEMIAILQRETAQKTFELHAKPPFIHLLEKLLAVLKPGGTIVMNHYLFQLDLDWGYPAALFEDLVPIVRTWISELLGCQEVYWQDFHPHWWIFLQKL